MTRAVWKFVRRFIVPSSLRSLTVKVYRYTCTQMRPATLPQEKSDRRQGQINQALRSIMAADHRPSYLDLYESGELEKRVEALAKMLLSCNVCPLDCGNNRMENQIARCFSGRLPIVSSYTKHFGEEPALTGSKGAGNIFFGNCNLRCVYCQNYQISQAHKEQIKNEVTHERLAEIMLELQGRGCHNINFVSPTHFAPQMARAILLATE